MNETIRLAFVTDQNRVVSVSVRRANVHITSAQVGDAMDDIIASNVVDTSGRGDLISKRAASLIVTDSVEYNVV